MFSQAALYCLLHPRHCLKRIGMHRHPHTEIEKVIFQKKLKYILINMYKKQGYFNMQWLAKNIQYFTSIAIVTLKGYWSLFDTDITAVNEFK